MGERTVITIVVDGGAVKLTAKSEYTGEGPRKSIDGWIGFWLAERIEKSLSDWIGAAVEALLKVADRSDPYGLKARDIIAEVLGRAENCDLAQTLAKAVLSQQDMEEAAGPSDTIN